MRPRTASHVTSEACRATSSHDARRAYRTGPAYTVLCPRIAGRIVDRRSFIRLTAVSTTSAALASCGTPENELIRFVPDDDIIPGQAVFKPSVCPLCSAGCGLTVRVMDADADVMRNGKSGIVRILAAKKLEGNAAYPVN